MRCALRPFFRYSEANPASVCLRSGRKDEIEDFLGTALDDLEQRVLRTPANPLTSFLEVRWTVPCEAGRTRAALGPASGSRFAQVPSFPPLSAPDPPFTLPSVSRTRSGFCALRALPAGFLCR